ncbi:ester hydrolase C11orf54 homolog [Prorops nasuta]|uniref:ester hydrolase C11orf54 homolog n=1 Tax=Prorops nasuta TaxID=863751 RepID=UPI0034CD4E5B
MTALNLKDLCIEKRTLYVPTFDEIKNVLELGLKKNFEEFSIEIVDCVDLTKQPFNLAATGLVGNPTLLEIGGPSFLLPTVQRNKIYDIKSLLKEINFKNDGFVIGAGAGPWPYINSNCELMMNILISSSEVKNKSHIASVNKEDQCHLQTLPNNETRLALLANLFVSEGKPGKVLKVYARKRIGQNDFIACMQKELANHYTENLVGLGGTFVMNSGKIKQHVMPDFSLKPLNSIIELEEWLHYYNMSCPLVAAGTFVSSESDIDLRVQHFHSFSNHGEGGHYHIDTTPETIEYLGYFNIGSTLYRVDQPTVPLQFGKD